jgi:hypothetical protein
MNLDRQSISGEAAGQLVSGSLPDEVRVVVGKDMELPQATRRLE